jgi:hypothetical protein
MVKVRVRALRIGAKEFRWTAELGSYLDTHRHCNRCVRLRVWGGGKNGRMLRADLIAPTDQGLWGDYPGAAYPTPGLCAPSSITRLITAGNLQSSAAFMN